MSTVPTIISDPLPKEQSDDNNARFSSYWDEIDKAAENKAPPSVPIDPAKPRSEAPAEPEVEPKAEPKKLKRKLTESAKAPSQTDIGESIGSSAPAVEAKPEARTVSPTEEHIGPIELPATAPEAQRSQFKQLKEIAKTFATESKAFKTKLGLLAQEMGIQLKADSPEEISASLEGRHRQTQSEEVVTPFSVITLES